MRGVFLLFLNSVLASLIELLSSDATPFSCSALLALLPPFDSQTLTISERRMEHYSPAAPSPDVILDYTYSKTRSAQVLEERGESIAIAMYRDCPEREIRTHLRPVEYARQAADYLLALNFTKGFLVSESSGFYAAVAKNLQEHPLLTLTDRAVVDPHPTVDQIEGVVGRLIKPTGSRIGVFLANGQTAREFIVSLKNYNLWQAGYAYVFSEEAGWTEGISGLLYLVDADAKQASSREEFEGAILYAQLVVLSRLLYLEEADYKVKLTQTFRGVARKSQLVLMNIQEAAVLIANASGSLTSSILFPGNTTVTPPISKPVLQVSMDVTGLNSDGSDFPEVALLSRGYPVAYSQANLQADLLPNYAIVNNSVSLGGFMFNETWTMERIKTYRNQLGLLYHPFGYSSTSAGVTKAFQKLGVAVPTNSPGNTPYLSDPKQSPLFYTARSGPAALALVAARFFHVFGWKKTAFIHGEEPDDVGFYENFVNASAQYDIEIVNDLKQRSLPFLLASVDQQLNKTLIDIMATAVRILVIAHPMSHLIAERLYDLGARSGDFLICLFYGLSYSLYAGPDTVSWKRRQIIKGGMMFYDRYFIGKEGEFVRKLLFDVDGLNYDSIGCVMYDSVMLLLQALKFMLMSGLHYEDGYALMQQIRNSRLIGCLGALQLGKGSNERTPGDYSILNAKYDEEKDTLVLEDAAVYSPVKVQMYNISSEIMFPDGSSQGFPDSWPMDPNCPYFVKNIRYLLKGHILGLGICLFFSLFTAISALVVWILTPKQQPAMLEIKCSITLEDGLALLTFPVELGQFLVLAPTNPLEIRLRVILRLISFQWEMFINATHGVFWALEILALSLVFVYILISVLKYFRVDVKVQEWGICSDLWYLVDLLLPTFSNVLFLPIVSVLLSSFQCSHSTGASFADSFLDRDCAERCWAGPHLIYTIIATISLLIYTVIELLTRPIWQEMQTNLHVKAMPLNLLVKSLLQVLLVTLAVSLQQNSPLAHAISYLAVTTVYLAFLFLTKPYNYER